MLDVFTHRIIIGSVQDLYASYIYILSLTAPPTPFVPYLIFAYSSLFSVCLHPYVLSIWRAICCYFFPF
jgi:hypothetical protein